MPDELNVWLPPGVRTAPPNIVTLVVPVGIITSLVVEPTRYDILALVAKNRVAAMGVCKSRRP